MVYDVLEKICHLVYDLLRLFFYYMLKFVNEDYAHPASFEQVIDTVDQARLRTSFWIGVANRPQNFGSCCLDGSACWYRDVFCKGKVDQFTNENCAI